MRQHQLPYMCGMCVSVCMRVHVCVSVCMRVHVCVHVCVCMCVMCILVCSAMLL